MDISRRLQLSYYKVIATLNEDHKIYIVQHSQNKHIYVKKVLDVYNYDIYKYLQCNHITGMPYIYELHEEDNTLTVIEEYISGQTLEEYLNQGYIFAINEIKDIVGQLCDILNSLHSCNPPIIHRDIKPSNIMLTDDGQVILLDLNAAKRFSESKSEDTTLLGTKGYAAPEQYGFGSSNPQTDIYALGMVINTLLYGEFSQVPYPDNDLTSIVEKCIKISSNERYKSVNELKKQIRLSHGKSRKLVYGKAKYLPPGFRHFKPFNMIVSTFIYFLVFVLCISMEIEGSTPTTLLIGRIFYLIACLGICLISSNYLGIQDLFPLCRSNNKFLRIIGIIVLNFIYVFAVMAIMVIICAPYTII